MDATGGGTPNPEQVVGVSIDKLASNMVLDSVKGFGPGAFRLLYREGISPADLLENPDLLPMKGKRGDSLREAIKKLDDSDTDIARTRALRQISRAAEIGAFILTYEHPAYPKNLLKSNNAVPILFARGDIDILRTTKVVACVGSRQIRSPYDLWLKKAATSASKDGWVIASGFANGADTIAHESAVFSGGSTVIVMPSGLDIPFPPENRSLWEQWVGKPRVVMISEFPIGTKASTLTLRKRNKTIVGISLGVLVAQSSERGGTMNSYRFAREQRKPVLAFRSDLEEDTSGNRLIEREGLTLDLNLNEAGEPIQKELEHWVRQFS